MTPAERQAAADAEDAAVEAAVLKQRFSNNSHFVFIERASAHLPGLRVKLEQEAKESGRSLVHEAVEPPAARLLREREARLADSPSIPRANHHRFLENLENIATGKVRCD